MATTMDGKQVLDRYFLEMRARVIEVAAALDRVERASGGAEVALSDPRLDRLRQAALLLGETGTNDRARRAQLIFSLEA